MVVVSKKRMSFPSRSKENRYVAKDNWNIKSDDVTREYFHVQADPRTPLKVKFWFVGLSALLSVMICIIAIGNSQTDCILEHPERQGWIVFGWVVFAFAVILLGFCAYMTWYWKNAWLKTTYEDMGDDPEDVRPYIFSRTGNWLRTHSSEVMQHTDQVIHEAQLKEEIRNE